MIIDVKTVLIGTAVLSIVALFIVSAIMIITDRLHITTAGEGHKARSLHCKPALQGCKVQLGLVLLCGQFAPNAVSIEPSQLILSAHLSGQW